MVARRDNLIFILLEQSSQVCPQLLDLLLLFHNLVLEHVVSILQLGIAPHLIVAVAHRERNQVGACGTAPRRLIKVLWHIELGEGAHTD